MTDASASGRGVQRPLFFLSYAHIPSSGADDEDPNLWVQKFFRKLCAEIMQLTALPADPPVGFMDRGMEWGERWPHRLSEALSTCQVFVPLYSPRYFRSGPCGQEWHCFASRAVRARDGSGSATAIVPVTWVRTALDTMPPAARELHFAPNEFGPAYEDEGLLALSKLGRFKDDYDWAVLRLAQRIIEVARQTETAEGIVGDFMGMPSAFAPARKLRISVLACEKGRLPVGRSAGTYGVSQLEWEPYQQPHRQPLVHHVTAAARLLNYETSVDLFEETAEELLRPPGAGAAEPSAPGLLLLDRWALLDPARRELVRRFDESNPSWVSVMEPWAQDDPENLAKNGELHELSQQTLRNKHEGRPSLRAAFGGLASLHEFDRELPWAAQRAMAGFEESRPMRDTTLGGRPRPTMRPAITGPSVPRPSARDDRVRGPAPSHGPSPGRDPVTRRDPAFGTDHLFGTHQQSDTEHHQGSSGEADPVEGN
ncbi:TIR-like protein FxsC [Streptacidiphilus sp. EB129]|uniref:TIR-like protein FxsC n=1 Tax=Streptacidiphilus sp. EB129 TaxID=3156262 RepID=UPI0035151E8B